MLGIFHLVNKFFRQNCCSILSWLDNNIYQGNNNLISRFFAKKMFRLVTVSFVDLKLIFFVRNHILIQIYSYLVTCSNYTMKIRLIHVSVLRSILFSNLARIYRPTLFLTNRFWVFISVFLNHRVFCFGFSSNIVVGGVQGVSVSQVQTSIFQ